MKKIFTVIIFFNYFTSSAQLSTEKLINYELGEKIEYSKLKIKNLFDKTPLILSSNFLGAHRIIIEDTNFDYYGLSNYCFQYMKDSLIAIRINFRFEAGEYFNFKRLITLLSEDFQSNNSFVEVKSQSTFKLNEALDYVSKYSRTTTKKEDKAYVPIKRKFLGRKFWKIYSNGMPSGKFIHIYVNFTETHNYSVKMYNRQEYDGSLTEITIEITDEKYFSLLDKESELIKSYYKNSR